MSPYAPSYLARVGPESGPTPPDPKRAPIEVFTDGEYGPVGVAQPRGWVAYEGTKAMTFALTIGEDELPGLWVCVNRIFVPLGSRE